MLWSVGLAAAYGWRAVHAVSIGNQSFQAQSLSSGWLWMRGSSPGPQNRAASEEHRAIR